MTLVHRYLAFTIPVGWAVLAVWALVTFIRNKAPGERFWTLVMVMQVVLGVQIVLGVILWVAAEVGGSASPPLLHYAYGALFPIFLLTLAHQWGRNHPEIAFVGFGAASFLIAGLTVRALMTGLGMG